MAHVSNLSFHGFKGDELVAALDLAGVQVSSGSACSAGTQEASPIVTAMLGRERAESALRVSMGDEVERADLEAAIAALFRVLDGAERRVSSDGCSEFHCLPQRLWKTDPSL